MNVRLTMSAAVSLRILHFYGKRFFFLQIETKMMLCLYEDLSLYEDEVRTIIKQIVRCKYLECIQQNRTKILPEMPDNNLHLIKNGHIHLRILQY